jgi:hypothetical protein
MYAVARSTARGTPTAGRHYVAAASVYTASDPFINLNVDTSPPCELSPYPQAVGAKIMLTSNNCDLVPCDDMQASEFDTRLGSDLYGAPGFAVKEWTESATSKIGTPTCIRWDLLDASDQDNLATNGCLHGNNFATKCRVTVGAQAHETWPSGRLAAMLDFLHASAIVSPSTPSGEQPTEPPSYRGPN